MKVLPTGSPPMILETPLSTWGRLANTFSAETQPRRGTLGAVPASLPRRAEDGIEGRGKQGPRTGLSRSPVASTGRGGRHFEGAQRTARLPGPRSPPGPFGDVTGAPRPAPQRQLRGPRGLESPPVDPEGGAALAGLSPHPSPAPGRPLEPPTPRRCRGVRQRGRPPPGAAGRGAY